MNDDYDEAFKLADFSSVPKKSRSNLWFSELCPRESIAGLSSSRSNLHVGEICK